MCLFYVDHGRLQVHGALFLSACTELWAVFACTFLAWEVEFYVKGEDDCGANFNFGIEIEFATVGLDDLFGDNEAHFDLTVFIEKEFVIESWFVDGGKHFEKVHLVLKRDTLTFVDNDKYELRVGNVKMDGHLHIRVTTVLNGRLKYTEHNLL